MSDRRPICPGCETLASPRQFDGVVRWACDTEDCPVFAFDDSENPDPKLGRAPVAPRRPAAGAMPLFAGRGER